MRLRPSRFLRAGTFLHLLILILIRWYLLVHLSLGLKQKPEPDPEPEPGPKPVQGKGGVTQALAALLEPRAEREEAVVDIRLEIAPGLPHSLWDHSNTVFCESGKLCNTALQGAR